MLKRIIASTTAAIALCCGVLLTGTPAHASARFESNDASYVKADETVDGNAYLAGQSIRMEGTVNGDLFCAGKEIVINGTVNGDVICAGATISISGKVTGNIRAAANSVTINAQTDGAATIFGSSITIENAAKISKDATLGGDNVVVNGAVGRDIVGGGNTFTVNGLVGRNIEGQYQNLAIGKDSTVSGYVHYGSEADAVISGKVAGDVKRDNQTNYQGNQASFDVNPFEFILFAILWCAVLAIAMQLVAPKKMHTITTMSQRDVLLSFAIGVLALVGLPIVAFLLMVSIVALPLGILLFVVWLAMMVASVGVAAIYIGRLILRKQKIHPIAATALGAVILGALIGIPILGAFVCFLAILYGLGAMLRGLRGEHEPEKRDPKVKLAKA